jgi:histidine triad (HIT) family protein
MATLFSRIVQGEVPCHKVAENEDFLAFMDSMPLRWGHVLVIPKQETDYIFDLEDELLGSMMVFAKEVARKIKIAFPCKKVGVTVIGLEVPHAHIHLVPMNSMNDMNFSQDKLTLSQEELAGIAQAIRDAA